MRHTKIIATVGPASDSDAVLDTLIAAGTDIIRLNFSHGTHQTHGATVARVRNGPCGPDQMVALSPFTSAMEQDGPIMPCI